MAGKFGKVIQKAREPETQVMNETNHPEDELQSVKPDEQKTIDPEVNLCIKVSKSLRRHWAAEAKRADITMTSVIMEALTQKFGLPNNQKD
jgi:hypothetical protein